MLVYGVNTRELLPMELIHVLAKQISGSLIPRSDFDRLYLTRNCKKCKCGIGLFLQYDAY